jgi:DNA-binding NarL/FixJ family response regulator
VPTRVLIVDDHPSFRRFAGRVLEAAGFAVVGDAQDAASALEGVARLRPDVVVLDIMLPDRSGVEVAQELSATPDPPQVVLTSSQVDLAGTAAFLPKHRFSGAALAELLTDR